MCIEIWMHRKTYRRDVSIFIYTSSCSFFVLFQATVHTAKLQHCDGFDGMASAPDLQRSVNADGPAHARLVAMLQRLPHFCSLDRTVFWASDGAACVRWPAVVT